MSETDNDISIKRTSLKLVGAVVLMFGFGFALVPLYDVLCDITGLGGKTAGQYEYEVDTTDVDYSRTVRVLFLANNNDGMPWEFRPIQGSIKVHPGELNEVAFFARNPSQTDITGQAVPSVTPGYAAEYLHKTECFCFNQQFLAAGEKADMPLRFFIDKDLPKHVKNITLSYTMFDMAVLSSSNAVGE